MGRPPSFDREKALARATELFWKRGYLNTTVSQLQAATKLGEGSFYNAFASKKKLFLECLRYYNATHMTRRAEALRSERPAQERIHEFFEVVIDDLTERRAPGCLVSNSLTSEVLTERELKRYLFDGCEAFITYLTGIVADGQQRGELHSELVPRVVARVLFTYLHGLHRLSVFKLDEGARREETRAFVNAVLRAP